MLAEQAALEAAPPKSPLQLVSDRTVRWQLITMSTIYFCNQMSGMPAVSFTDPPPLQLPKHPEVTALSPPSQITIFSFDIFLKAGIPRDKIRYVTLCLGACEIITSISCVSSSHRSRPDHDSDALSSRLVDFTPFITGGGDTVGRPSCETFTTVLCKSLRQA